MITTKSWYGSSITLDEDKYCWDQSSPEGPLLIIDKENYDLICAFNCPGFILQVGENEFVLTDAIDRENYRFQHIHYLSKDGLAKTIFSKKYKPRNKATGSVEIIDDNIFIIKSWLTTIVYNSTENKSLTLNDATIISPPDIGNYLIAHMNIKDKDYLTMYIDKKSLEAKEFYSNIQARVISVIKTFNSESNNFENRLDMTIQKEVIKYIELLEEQERKYQEYSSIKAREILLSRITDEGNMHLSFENAKFILDQRQHFIERGQKSRKRRM